MSLKATTLRMIDERKAKLAELDADWERLDSQGRATEQELIVKEMARLTVEIQDFEALAKRMGWIQ